HRPGDSERAAAGRVEASGSDVPAAGSRADALPRPQARSDPAGAGCPGVGLGERQRAIHDSLGDGRDGRCPGRAPHRALPAPPGQSLIAIAQEGKVWVVADFKEPQVARMHVSQPVSVRVDAYPGVELRGRSESLAPNTGARLALFPADNATGNFTKVVQRVPV